MNFQKTIPQSGLTKIVKHTKKRQKKPFADFVEIMIQRIQKFEPEVCIKASDAIMRINKDIRFSKDKTPYNTYVAANISVYGKKDKSYPGFYFQLSPVALSIYGGAYMVENTMLHKIREHIAHNPKAFSKAYNDSSFKEKFGTIQGERHKRVPSEFQEISAKRTPHCKQTIYYTGSLKPDMITSEKLPEKLMEYYLAGKKLNDFLKLAWT